MDDAREATMEVENSGEEQQTSTGTISETEKASGQQSGGLLGMAKRGIEILKEKLTGRTL